VTLFLLGTAIAALAACLLGLLWQRKRMRELERNALRFESLIAVADDVIWMSDLHGRFTFVSPSAERQSGFSIAEIKQFTLPNLVRDKTVRTQVNGLLQTVRETGTLPRTRLEIEQHRKDGEAIWTDICVGVLRDTADKAEGLIGITRDMTKQRDLRIALATRAVAVEEAAEAITVLDRKGTIEYVNPAYERLTGYTSAELVGQQTRMFEREQDQMAFEADLLPMLARGEIWRGEINASDRSGRSYVADVSIAPVHNACGEMQHMVAVIRDITEAKRMEEELERRAHFDELTGLPNRALFFDRLDDRLRQAQRLRQQLALLFIDLDAFKDVNDAQGHAAGDIVLVEVTRRLQKTVRASDTLARLSGDEFALVTGPAATAIDTAQLAIKVLAAMAPPFLVDRMEHRLGASIGIACYPDDAVDATALLGLADLAMYSAKRAGKNCFRYANG